MHGSQRNKIAITSWEEVSFKLTWVKRSKAIHRAPQRHGDQPAQPSSPAASNQASSQPPKERPGAIPGGHGHEYRRNGPIPRSRWQGLFLIIMVVTLIDSAAAITLPPPWRWSNPTPHGANIVDQVANAALSVQVGERGQIYLSDDWLLWTPRETGTTAALRGATFFGGRLVVTGEQGTILFADDPWDFHGLKLDTADWLESIAASEELVVAVGDRAAIYISTNAVDWLRLTPPFSHWLRSVAYSGTRFVTVGEGGLIASSEDGIQWQVQPSLTTTDLDRVTWAEDHFLAVGNSGVAFTSTEGSQWAEASLDTTNALFAAAGSTHSHLAAGDGEVQLALDGGQWLDQLADDLLTPAPVWTYYSALWDNGAYLLAGRSGMLAEGSQTNATVPMEWQPLSDSVRTWLWSVTRTPTHFVAVGDYGTIFTSPNGVDWDLELAPSAATNSVLLGVGGNSNSFLVVGTRGMVLWSTNVFLWHEVIPRPTSNDLQGVCFDGQQFILSGGNGTILSSPNGTNWTLRTTPTDAFLMSVAAGPSGLVCVGEEGTILTSSDYGLNWTIRPSGTTNWLSQVRWLNDRWVVVGENGCILTSSDGQTWHARTSGTTAWLNAAEFCEDTWFVAGNQGTVLGSPDATNWFSFGTLTRKSLYGLTLHEGQLLAVGTEGVILRSRLIPDTTPIRVARFERASGMNVFLFTGATDQQFRLQSSEDLLTWSDGALLEFYDSSGTLLYVEESQADSPAMFYRAKRVE